MSKKFAGLGGAQSHDILSYEETRNRNLDFWTHYLEEVESWIEYCVEEVEE